MTTPGLTLRGSAAVMCGLTLSACASGFSDDLRYWNSIAQGQHSDRYGEWASCIEGSIATGISFAAVLGRCEALQVGPAWSALSYEDERRLLTAALNAYRAAQAEAAARDAEAIVNR